MSYGAVYRVVETPYTPNESWSSRPYATRAAARNRASHLNNEAQHYHKYCGHAPKLYVVEVLEGDWERVDG